MCEPGYKENTFLNESISFGEITNIVKNLKLNKATGEDTILNEILKSLNIMIFMYRLFAHCFEYGIVPAVWNLAIITPVFKKGKDPYNPLSYRGISLLSCIGKVLVYSALSA